MKSALAHFQTLPHKDARQRHHAFQEIEIKRFIIHPSSFILFTMLGSTLSNDPLPDKRFDFQFVNPPYGYEWSKDYDVVTTRRDLHPDLLADYVLANPPFNDSDNFRKDDGRGQFGVTIKTCNSWR